MAELQARLQWRAKMGKFGKFPMTAFAAGLFAMTAMAQQKSPPTASNASEPAVSTVQAKSIEVPQGTKVLLALRSAVNTKTAKPGDGVYLSSNFPVVVDGHVAIPAGVYVQGVIDQVVRPGRIKGRAAVRMHFTSMIFPNGSVVNIPGVVNSLPGSDGAKVQDEGTIQQAPNKGKDAGTIAQGTIEGASLGTIGGAIAGHPGAGAGYGALAGGAAGLIYTLFTRGNDVVLNTGEGVEMVLQRPLTISQSNLTGPDVAGQAAVPSAQQPMGKPKSSILCPPGGLGCS
jgi:type IV secretion system protein VirB10